MRNAWLEELQTTIKRNINNLRYADDTTLTAESEEELKSLLMRVKEDSERVGLRLNIKNNLRSWHPAPLIAWQIEVEKVEVVTDFLFLGAKITADADCSHEIKRQLLLRKAVTNLDSVLKSRDITLPTKGHIVKTVVFPVVTYNCENWTVKKAERQRIDVFKLWY